MDQTVVKREINTACSRVYHRVRLSLQSRLMTGASVRHFKLLSVTIGAILLCIGSFQAGLSKSNNRMRTMPMVAQSTVKPKSTSTVNRVMKVPGEYLKAFLIAHESAKRNKLITKDVKLYTVRLGEESKYYFVHFVSGPKLSQKGGEAVYIISKNNFRIVQEAALK